ncbi:MAG: hypothetical protein VX675_04490 [Planctomycetota bacterium]|nr:hypothetical protein [Planctomycetota bacterium]
MRLYSWSGGQFSSGMAGSDCACSDAAAKGREGRRSNPFPGLSFVTNGVPVLRD